MARNHNEWTYLFLAAAQAQLGNQEEASAALAHFDRLYAQSGEDPFTVSRVEHWAFKRQTDRERVKEGLRKAGLPFKDGESAIVPVMLGDAKLSQVMANALLDEGIYVIGFFYPVVPKGEARIRVQLSAAHTREHLDRALAAFEKVGKELGVI